MVATSERSSTRGKKQSSDKAASKNSFKTPPPDRKPVVLGGAKAKNPHFMIDRAIHAKASERAAEEGTRLSEVMRQGLEQYAAGSPDKADGSALEVLPPDTLAHLEDVWRSGDTHRVNAYLASLYRAGWPLRTLSNSIGEIGTGKIMTRQAVSQRVLRAPEELPEDLPPVPALGFRRLSNRQVARPKEAAVDVSFRIKDEDYRNAAARAKAEGAMVSSVVEDILRRYAEGEFAVKVAAADKGQDAESVEANAVAADN